MRLLLHILEALANAAVLYAVAIIGSVVTILAWTQIPGAVYGGIWLSLIVLPAIMALATINSARIRPAWLHFAFWAAFLPALIWLALFVQPLDVSSSQSMTKPTKPMEITIAVLLPVLVAGLFVYMAALSPLMTRYKRRPIHQLP
jgi:hypothetical protein